jgi:2-oxoisovalerate dehydrogenase E2 component (dihydrolipoyl transacylase)
MGQYSFKLPDIGEGTAEAEIAAWHVKVGDRIEEDQPLVEMMTDKASVELTSPVGGIVQSVAAAAGEKVAVGAVLVVLETTGGEATNAAAAVAPFAPAHVPAQSPAPERRAPVMSTPSAVSEGTVSAAPAGGSPAAARDGTVFAASAVAPPATATRPGRATASPAVRRRADELGVDLQFVEGTGPAGRIGHSDLDAYLANQPAVRGAAYTHTPAGDRASSSAARGAPATAAGTGAGSRSQTDYAHRSGVEEIPVIGLRRQIAERMQLAKRQIPHFSYVDEVDVTDLEELRAHLNASKKADQPKLTVLPFIMRALVSVLPDFPQINATYDDEAGVIRRHAAVHMGIATQTPKGLMVTVVRHAETRNLWNSATEVARLAGAARDGKATREDLSGSTITLTSLGPLGGLVTTPVINRPEVAIVGPNKIVERVVVRAGQITVRKMMNLSSSFDHRVVDGMDAAEFIQRIRTALEHPATLFIPHT